MRKLLPLFVLIAVLVTPSCKLFKKKCDCPDHHKKKRIAMVQKHLNPSFC
ncbi:MAG TPA: hypothetical protein PL185_08015 [Flavobacteriales bacterium]|nr:hypothetical protein [Flavobacteriales bacterium]HPH82506.1 hypothetical protein [Flavobacteriales bacterium]